MLSVVIVQTAMLEQRSEEQIKLSEKVRRPQARLVPSSRLCVLSILAGLVGLRQSGPGRWVITALDNNALMVFYQHGQFCFAGRDLAYCLCYAEYASMRWRYRDSYSMHSP